MIVYLTASVRRHLKGSRGVLLMKFWLRVGFAQILAKILHEKAATVSIDFYRVDHLSARSFGRD